VKIIIKGVSGCYKCDFFNHPCQGEFITGETNKRFKCGKLSDRFIPDDIIWKFTFPEWCPLPNWKGEKIMEG